MYLELLRSGRVVSIPVMGNVPMAGVAAFRLELLAAGMAALQIHVSEALLEILPTHPLTLPKPHSFKIVAH
jgi:hypothetical protein